MSDYTKYELGKKFPLDIKIRDPGDHYWFNVVNNTIILAYFYYEPSAAEIVNITDGKYRFAITELMGIPFFLTKFGDMSWTDMAINQHAMNEYFTVIPNENQGYPINIMMVDRGTDIIKAMRVISPGCSFSIALKESLERNRERNYDEATYRQIVFDLHKKYTTKQLLSLASVYINQR